MSVRTMFVRLSVVFALLPCCESLADGASLPKDLHLPALKGAAFPSNLTDSGGGLWDIQYFLNIGQGSGVYAGGLFCRLNGQNVSSNGQGWMGQQPDEIEIGPFNFQAVQVFRRIKVYRDLPMARWLDIIINTSPTPQTVPLEVFSSYVTDVQLNSGPTGNPYTVGDWAMVTELENHRAALHIFATPRSNVIPAVRQQGQQTSAIYNVTVPANSAAIVCYFESQGEVEELQSRIKNVPFAKLLSDLSDPVRRLIVNMSVPSANISLRRRDNADAILLKNGDSLYGRILNEQFALQALFGKADVPAGDVIGFASPASQDAPIKVVLVGGQVISGKLSDETIRFALSTGGELAVPFARVAECSYRVSKDKPDSEGNNQPLIILRTGDRLAFDPAQLKCSLLSRHGRIELSPADLAEIRLTDDEQRAHQVRFANGSTLSGLLEGEKISLQLTLGKKLDVPRDMVEAIQFNRPDKPNESMTKVELDNGDVLFGRLADGEYAIQTEFGLVKIKPANILSLQFDKDDPSRVSVRLWDGTTLRGQLQQEALELAILPGPTVKLFAGQIKSVRSNQSLPPEEVLTKVDKLISQLSGPQYEERQQAQEELIRMGPAIAPLLKKYADDADPDIRQRIATILESLDKSTPAPSVPD